MNLMTSYGFIDENIIMQRVFEVQVSLYHFSLVNYVDDTTPYTRAENFDKIIEKLEKDVRKVCKWFNRNHFNANSGKLNFLLGPFEKNPINKNEAFFYTIKQCRGSF